MSRAADTLRTWLLHLHETGRLQVARERLGLRFEIATMNDALQGQSATLFPRPDGGDVPVVSGVLSNRRWFAEAAGVQPHELLGHIAKASEAPTPWREVSPNEAPTREVVHEGSDVDLTRLPIPTRSELDAGPYIDSGLVSAADPEADAQNLSIHRLQLHSKDRLGILMLPRDLAALFRAAESRGRDLPVAISIGADPMTELASQVVARRGIQELEVAGSLRGEPLRVVRTHTSELRVPADAEITIEGRLRAHRRALEGPYGEFSRYYQPRALRPYIQVDAVTHRRNPIYRTIFSYSIEHLLLGGVMREASLLDRLQASTPGAIDLRLTIGGSCRYRAVVKMRVRHRGEAKNCLLAVLGLHADIKHVVVVDDDVDIDDNVQVLWALTTRYQADQDTVIVSNAMGSAIDPSTDEGLGAKLGMDATVPAERRGRFTVAFSPHAYDLDVRHQLQSGAAAESALRDAVGEPAEPADT